MELVPGRIPDYLLDDSIGLLRADDRVFEAMLDGWRAQQLARGLTTAHIKTSSRMVTRFQEHTNEYPWTCMAHHFEEFLDDGSGSATESSTTSRHRSSSPTKGHQARDLTLPCGEPPSGLFGSPP